MKSNCQTPSGVDLLAGARSSDSWNRKSRVEGTDRVSRYTCSYNRFPKDRGINSCLIRERLARAGTGIRALPGDPYSGSVPCEKQMEGKGMASR